MTTVIRMTTTKARRVPMVEAIAADLPAVTAGVAAAAAATNATTATQYEPAQLLFAPVHFIFNIKDFCCE